jgi:murein L,D-transpeptidase YcbB/YkuD
MNKFITAACALALAFAWSSAPAIAADDAVKTDDKTVKEKAVDIKDKTKDKAVEIKDKTKEKAVEIKDKTKEKLVEGKDKVKGAFKRDKTDKDMPAQAGMTDVRGAQQALMDKGYKPGPIDGIHGPRTSAAVREFQTKEGLKVTGQLDADTMAKLNLSTAAVPAAPGSTAPAASPATEGAAKQQTK